MSFVGRCEAMSATFAANVAVRFLEEASWPGDLEEIHVVCNDEGGDGKSQAFELARFADAAAVMPDASMGICYISCLAYYSLHPKSIQSIHRLSCVFMICVCPCQNHHRVQKLQPLQLPTTPQPRCRISTWPWMRMESSQN
jgi:hypothetical protein